jgi:hypothetical protein
MNITHTIQYTYVHLICDQCHPIFDKNKKVVHLALIVLNKL